MVKIIYLHSPITPSVSQETHLIPMTRFAISTTDDSNQIHGWIRANARLNTRSSTASTHTHTYICTHGVHRRTLCSCMRWYPFSQWFIEVEARGNASRWSVSKYNGQTVGGQGVGWGTREWSVSEKKLTSPQLGQIPFSLFADDPR